MEVHFRMPRHSIANFEPLPPSSQGYMLLCWIPTRHWGGCPLGLGLVVEDTCTFSWRFHEELTWWNYGRNSSDHADCARSLLWNDHMTSISPRLPIIYPSRLAHAQRVPRPAPFESLLNLKGAGWARARDYPRRCMHESEIHVLLLTEIK